MKALLATFKPLSAIFLSFLLIFSSVPQQASALSGSNFNAGNIMGDGVFFNPNTMNAQQIQAFLNAKVPVCDTWGTKQYSPGKTRAQYGAERGNPTPYTCLKEYSADTPAKSAEPGLCGAYGGGVKSAAQIIADVSQLCGVNPQVLLVLLQKEQSLVTDDWPWNNQYQSATGYGCPDTASCNPAYAGLFNQLYYAARIYKVYAANPNAYNHRQARQNNVRFNPNTACGSSSVYIYSQATAGLYNYTPYQPNQAALNNLYGSGDSCSAYGNRNFWRMFSEWFGSTETSCTYPNSDGSDIFRLLQPDRNSQLLTTDPTEVCTATSRYGFVYDGVIGQSVSGGSGVYRLHRNGNYLYTISEGEKNTAIQSYGFSLDGIAFLATTSSGGGTYLPLNRLAYPMTGGYYYTPSTGERDSMAGEYGFRNEGAGFYINNPSGSSLHNIYRLAHPRVGYLFTPSEDERNAALQSYGFRDEGIGFQTRNGFTADNLPIYRLASSKGYILTSSFGERKYAMQVGYRPEGIGFYAYPLNNYGASKLVYRLSHPSGTYLYTSSIEERDSAVNNYGFRFEGIGFRIP